MNNHKSDAIVISKLHYSCYGLVSKHINSIGTECMMHLRYVEWSRCGDKSIWAYRHPSARTFNTTMIYKIAQFRYVTSPQNVSNAKSSIVDEISSQMYLRMPQIMHRNQQAFASRFMFIWRAACWWPMKILFSHIQIAFLTMSCMWFCPESDFRWG